MNKNKLAIVIIVIALAGIAGYFTLVKKDKNVSNVNPQLQSTSATEEISRLDTQGTKKESIKTYITSDKVSGGSYKFKYSSELFIKDDYVYIHLNGFIGPHMVALERFADNIPAGTPNYNRIEINAVRTSCDVYKYCKTIKGFNIGTNSNEASFLGLYNQLLDSFEVL